MFDYLKGKVASATPGRVVLDVGGVGFSLAATLHTAARVTVGTEATLYTYLHVREESLELFGFAEREEQACFLLLLGVSGVGPKAALAILSAVTPQALALAVVTEDEKTICAAQGVGKKLASRIILELKDKLAKEHALSGAPAPVSVAGDDALDALLVLGYRASEANAALARVDATLPTEDRVREALRALL